MSDSPDSNPDPVRAARAEVRRAHVAPADDEGAAGEQPGEWIDRYKLLQQIGEGGFGTVWMAEQSEPVRRRVALKIIKLGMDTRQVVARFEAERQALALMDHPHIAKVLDGGATGSGRPYFVMELVTGVPIVEYCDRSNLTVHERLALAAQVCRAVQHAHNKGIIHRDIKPSNVLVATQDGRPQAKVIDFGIAKATSQTLTEKTLFTEHRQVIGTLQYMSPEQAHGSLDIDTRTDVYSLGVLLYELLTGSTPFDATTLRGAAYGEIQRIIREVDPPRPSTRLSQSAEALVEIAAHRRVEPRRLGLLLRGELDWIVMKALEKDRARRYATADGLSGDLQRYLDGEAVEAAPPSRAYQLRKFVRRHRVLMSGAAAVALALLVGLAAFAWQAREARAQRDLALEAQRAEVEQRERAQLAEAAAEARAGELAQVAEFQAGMLAQLDPTRAGRLLSDDVSQRHAAALARSGLAADERAERDEAFRVEWARVNATDAALELIDRALLRPALATLDERFADQPLVDARLRQVLADRYRGLGLYDAARPQQERALATRRRELGDAHPLTLESLDSMGLTLHALGRDAEAEPYFREALAASRHVLGDTHPLTLDRICNVGTALEGQGALDEAESYQREALELARRVNGGEHSQMVTALNNLAYLFESQGKLDEAEAHYREALQLARRVLGEEHRNTLSAISNLGVLLHTQGHLDEAEPLYREALEKRRRLLGEEHPDTLLSIANLGALLKFQGKLEQAEPLYLEALEKRRRALGPDHPATLISLNNLGALLWAQGKLAAAEPCYREALESKRRVLGPEHASTLHSAISLGGLQVALERHAEAAALLAAVEPAARVAFADGNRHQLGRLLSHLGRARAALGELEAAEWALLEAYDLLEPAPGATDEDRRSCVEALVELYARLDAAEPGAGHDAARAEWSAKL